MASEKEMLKFCATFGNVYEESAHHKALDGFCEALVDAYYADDEDGAKWTELMNHMRERLPPEVFIDVFEKDF